MKYLKVALLACLLGLIAWTDAQAFSVTLSWNDNSDNETGFVVERSLNGSDFIRIGDIGINSVTYVDTMIEQSTDTDNKYCYRVAAYNEAGYSTWSTTANPGVTDCMTIPRLSGPLGMFSNAVTE